MCSVQRKAKLGLRDELVRGFCWKKQWLRGILCVTKKRFPLKMASIAKGKKTFRSVVCDMEWTSEGFESGLRREHKPFVKRKPKLLDLETINECVVLTCG